MAPLGPIVATPLTVPDSQERADLLLAGLGEKITMDEFSHSREIYSELIFQFPNTTRANYHAFILKNL